RMMIINLMFRPLTIDDDGDTLGITILPHNGGFCSNRSRKLLHCFGMRQFIPTPIGLVPSPR
ncbi:hypothetical protein RDWZM_009489, partial [Blomia tropicalis]